MLRDKIEYLGRASAIAVAGMLFISHPAMAQDAGTATATTNETGLGEIVVTAQRREQNLQDVPVAISAIGSDSIRNLGIRDSSDISKAVAGVTLNASIGGGGANSNLVVRGIAQTDLSATQESPNSIYIDDVYLSSPNAAGFAVYDLSRIEVLRGPQGTLFGRASSGGLANFITTKPSKRWNGFADVSYSSYNDVRLEAAVGGPLSDRVRFRLSGGYEKADGWLQNSSLKTPNQYEKNSFGIRGQLEADLTDAFTARLSVSYDKSPRHREGTYISTPATIDAVTGQPRYLGANEDQGTGPGNDFFGYRDTDGKFNATGFNDLGYLTNERFSPSLYLTYNLGDATITSISNYTKFKFDYQEDSDGGPVDIAQFHYSQNLDQYSQEIRLNGRSGNLTYTAGFYYLNTNQVQPQNFPFTAFSVEFFNDVKQKTNSWALFTQLEYKLTDKLNVTGGIRFTNEKKNFFSRTFAGGLGAANILIYDFSASNPVVGSLAHLDDKLWSGKVGLDYKPDDNTLLYLTVSRGVKAGGFNTNLNGFPDQKFLDSNGGLDFFGVPEKDFIPDTRFKDEHLMAYEGGAKLDLLDRKLRVNLSAFYYNYTNFQGYNFRGVAGVVANNDARFYGAELEVHARPMAGLDLNLAASYLHTKLFDVTTAHSGTLDQQAAQAPKWTVNGSVTKRFELPFGTLGFTWDGNYLGSRYTSTDNNVGTLIRSSFVHNARVSLDIEKAGLELAFFVKNISNNDRMIFSYDLAGSFGNFLQGYAPPRWIGGSIRKSF
ncbi:MAG: TonB-dependent receptor [Novosphingobium sp.]|uniref:TonB-dependent receptor n=1 Tax=Novosphingobium sp. TaxID=1874826 RepID=UPI00301AEAD7